MPSQAPYGDAESLFLAAHADLVRAVYALLGNHADTEDAAQNSFYKLMVAWDRVAELPTAGEQRAYLIRIMINEALQILRYPHRKWERLGVDAGEYEAVQGSPDEKVEAREDLQLVWKAIGELPGVRREVVVLRAAGYENREIAARLGISKSTVRSHISYARQQLSRTAPRGQKGAQG
ncbi:MAG TPA: RNA polymerase sigma factor [Streptosporangiaceae bacterium]|nr:RNA polymerase sigma factor [Streptosporangiaceae bacterium]